MDVRDPPSTLSSAAPAAAAIVADAANDTAANPATVQPADATKLKSASDDTAVTVAETTDAASIATTPVAAADKDKPAAVAKEVPAADASAAPPAAAPPALAAVAASEIIELTDSDSLDDDIDNMIVTETETDATPQDDELLREMEEIEGTLQPSSAAAASSSSSSSKPDAAAGHPAEDVTAAAAKVTASSTAPGSTVAEAEAVTTKKPAVTTAEQATSDLLKDLESGGDNVESSSPSSSSSSSVTPAASSTAVDSTSGEASSLKSTHSAELSAAADAAVTVSPPKTVPEAAAEAAASDDETPMDVDDDEENVADASAIVVDKDDGISSTSSEETKPSSAVEGASAVTANNETVINIAAVDDTPSLEDATAPKSADNSAVSSSANAPSGETLATTVDDLDSSVNKSTAPIYQHVPICMNIPGVSAHDMEVALIGDVINMLKGGCSTPNSMPTSAYTTPNAFSRGKVQFEISSENMSQICGSDGDSRDTSSVAPTAPLAAALSTSELSSASSTGTEPEPQSSSDNLTHYAKVLKQFNGLGDSTRPSPTVAASVSAVTTAASAAAPAEAPATTLASSVSQQIGTGGGNLVTLLSNGGQLDHSTEELVRDNKYEICVWYDQSEMVYLNVERKRSPNNTTTTATTDVTGSTNGSVTSVGPFTLPSQTQHSIASSDSSTTSPESTAAPVTGDTVRLSPPQNPLQQPPRVRQTVHGVLALANFMIEHFGKIKRDFGGAETGGQTSTPVAAAGRGGRATQKKNIVKSAAAAGSPDVLGTASPSAPASRRQKRTAAPSDTDEEPSAKKVKAVLKKDTAADANSAELLSPASEVAIAGDAKPVISVLARWADKKYYAGRLKEAKPNNRYVVVFEDGATKTLAQDVIVFGSDNGVLPLLDQYVHARIDGDGDTYEPGLVTAISTTAGEPILYTVVAESQTVTVTSSDLYLEEEQAKAIQRATEANVSSAVAATSGVGGDEAAATAATLLKSPGTPTSSVTGKRAARPTAKFGEAAATATSSTASPRSRGSATKAKAPTTTTGDAAEPSTSAAAVAAASSASGRQTGRRNKRYS